MEARSGVGGRAAPVLPRLAAQGWSVEQVATLEDGIWVGPGAGAGVDYPADAHARLVAIEERSAWFAERNRLIADALGRDGLPPELLEVGAGNGFVSAHLRRLGVDAVAVEPARGAALAAAGRGVPTVCGLLEDLALPPGAIAAAGAFDVLEHLADPAPLLAELRRVLAPGGRLVVTVPAMPSLWSQADAHAGHHRRYRAADLRTVLASAGFQPRSLDHAFAALVPAVGLLRALPHRLGRVPTAAEHTATGTRQVAGYGRLGSHAARAAFTAERSLRRRVPLRLGTSLVGVFAV